ncbi:hypothetical protein Tco_1065926, partial [Tanacetum coccineum]
MLKTYLLKSVCKCVERGKERAEGNMDVVRRLGTCLILLLTQPVQFNLQLSSKEKSDRAKVVLPCEHQETGKSVQIYDGRKSLNEYVQVVWAWKMSQAELVKVEAPVVKAPPDLLVNVVLLCVD